MSRIGEKIINVPGGIEVVLDGNVISAKGPKGALSLTVPACLIVKLGKGSVQVQPEPEGAGADVDALYGLNRSLISNMIEGVAKGYAKELEIQGVGFKATVQGKKIVFSLGYSTPVELEIPEGTDVKVADSIRLTVSGPDKQLVGDFSARIKSLYPAEPYKGKGIRFKGEYIRRKVGKTATA